MTRVDKHNYYLDICQTILTRSTCLRRSWGAIIVKNDEIISSGYNGAPRGRKNCSDLGHCRREELNIPRGQRYEMCRSTHAEQNAIISAKRSDMINATMYMVGMEISSNNYVQNSQPCSLCKKFIINSGIKTVIVRDSQTQYRILNVEDWITNDDSLTGNGGY